jgi:hypothetical protein
MDKEVQKGVLRELKRPHTWICKINQNAVITPILISTLNDRRTFDLKALLDSSATSCYIDEGFTRAKGLTLESLPCPIPVYNADGSHNKGGPIRTIVKLHLQIADHIEVFTFAVTNTGKTDIIIGYDWLPKHNPSINWRTGHLTFNHCPLTCYQSTSCSKNSEPEDDMKRTQTSESIGLEEGDHLFVTKMDPGSVKDPYWEKVYERMEQHAMMTQSHQLAEDALKKGEKMSLEELLPKYLEDFMPVFEKASFDCLPEQCQWDHAIKLKPGIEPFNSKIYPLSLMEQAELDKFIEEHLCTGQIRPSKSPIVL